MKYGSTIALMEWFKANPTAELTTAGICEAIQVSRNTARHAGKVCAKNGMLQTRKEREKVIYSLPSEGPTEIVAEREPKLVRQVHCSGGSRFTLWTDKSITVHQGQQMARIEHDDIPKLRTFLEGAV